MGRIAVVGTGPYGLIMLDQLIQNYTKPEKLEILAFDPAGLGGLVWNTKQDDAVLMNSVMEHVTLFSDQLDTEVGIPRPSLYEWSKNQAPDFIKEHVEENQAEFLRQAATLKRNDCCQRRFYGLYQQWFFLNLQANLPENISLTFYQDQVKDLIVKEQITLIAQEKHLVDQVVLATGHSENELTVTEQQLKVFAEEQQLTYQPPKNPATVSLDSILPQEDVILRGLGLSFFDYVALLTKHWGGKFVDEAGELYYQPSGKEGKMILGSGRGVPYHARPVNQKLAGEDAQPQILTNERIEKFQPGEATEFFDLLKKEVELVYYEKKLANTSIDINAFLSAYRKEDRKEVLERFEVPVEMRWDWDALVDPGKGVEPENFTAFIQNYMEKDINEAEKGNLTGAVAAALDTMKELQMPVHKMIERKAFTSKEYWEELWGNYDSMYGFLTVGPPVLRMKQLAALNKAGIAVFLAPDMEVVCENDRFIAFSKQNEQVKYVAKHLIEARLPTTSYRKTLNPLIKALKNRGYLAPDVVRVENENHESGALKVERSTHRIVDQQNHTLNNLYCYGAPLAGFDWLNAASPRPKNRDQIFQVANQIVQSIYQK
ncbi:FAD/NAD(P)-binding protein [Enterococcus sp. AZ109]|uniref:FAD/NAD(P)-binding protein n=1 Tax=Enterococcus sp. AZ109 TaxID=2774634 RepID=UPI003F262274